MDDITEILSDKEVKRLTTIAEGGIKNRSRHWYTFGLRLNNYFSLEEQLDAIRLLGNTRSEIAYNYLTELNYETYMQSYPAGESISNMGKWYPNAEGELREVLIHRWYYDRNLQTRDVYKNHPKREFARKIIIEAYEKLHEYFSEKPI